MTSFKQIVANRLNALKSTGPRSAEGKRRSRQNAVRHGLTAETVISALENAADYEAFESSIAFDYRTRSATERELVSRLASVLWRLRRSTTIETGLFQIQAELMRNGNASIQRSKPLPLPEWYDELDVAPTNGSSIASGDDKTSMDGGNSPQTLGCCFLRVGRLGYGSFDLLNRYETALWRQAAQLLFLLQTTARTTADSKGK
jgi:hypothetical protein